MEEAKTYKLDWQGRKIEIIYRERSFAGSAHLQIRSRHAEPLPVTETGYLSRFTNPGDVAELGGPAAYVETWLNAAARTKAWRRAVKGGFQLALL